MADSAVDPSDRRTPLVLLAVTGERAASGHDPAAAPAGAARAAADALAAMPGTVVIRHDLRDLGEGVVRRTVRTGDRTELDVLELAHGCVSCTLRADLLPLLRTLAARGTVTRIVLDLDPAFEADAVCEAIENVVVTGMVGRVDGPASLDVRVAAVLTCLDERRWFADATGDEALADRGLSTVDDERTVAQVALAQVEAADALLLTGCGEDPAEAARTAAVLARLVPDVPVARLAADAAPTAEQVELLLARTLGRRRATGFDPHAPLLRGQPPLTADCGVEWVEFAADRPFHPARLHDALDVLLDGVVTARGRMWLATQPDEVVWLESAGGGLRVGGAERWLAAMSPEERAAADPERQALAALRWDERFGDRHVSLVVLVHDADPTEIRRALHWALVEDDELLLVQRAPGRVAEWGDPFGDQHTDPCADTAPPGVAAPADRHPPREDTP